MKQSKPHPVERLAQLILGDHALASTTATGMLQFDWNELLDLASAWRLIPQLSRQLDIASIKLNPVVADRIAQLETAAAAHSAMVCQMAAVALANCINRDVGVAAFKGVAAIALLYGSPSRRMVNDADVLLRFDQLEKAMEIFRASGFVPASDLDLERWNRVLEERVLPFHDYIVVKNPHGVEIDVHWRIAAGGGHSLDMTQVLERSEKVKLQRKQVRVVAPLDSILLTAHHSLRERFRPHVAIKDLYDQMNWLDVIEPDELPLLVNRAKEWGLETALLASWKAVGRLNRNSLAVKYQEETRSLFSTGSDEIADQLANYFALQLSEGSVSESMLGLSSMSPAMVHRFFSSRWRRLTDDSAEAHEIREHVEGGNWQAFQRLLRNLVTLSPQRYRMYKTMAQENKRMIGDDD